MRLSFDADRIPGYRAEERMEAVRRFRRLLGRYQRPDDVNQLLKQFPRVSIQSGFVLDYLSLGARDAAWIWPYARQDKIRGASGAPEPLAGVPSDRLAGLRGSSEGYVLAAEALYRFLDYEQSPLGLFEYAIFVNELWATKSKGKAADWLEIQPLFVKHRFDSILRTEARRIVKFSRPKTFDPVSRITPGGGGEASFLVFQPGPWKRIYTLILTVDPKGWVQTRDGEVLASLTS
jgi:hypothetical protein